MGLGAVRHGGPTPVSEWTRSAARTTLRRAPGRSWPSTPARAGPRPWRPSRRRATAPGRRPPPRRPASRRRGAAGADRALGPEARRSFARFPRARRRDPASGPAPAALDALSSPPAPGGGAAARTTIAALLRERSLFAARAAPSQFPRRPPRTAECDTRERSRARSRSGQVVAKEWLGGPPEAERNMRVFPTGDSPLGVQGEGAPGPSRRRSAVARWLRVG